MFSKSITESDMFLDLPPSAQALYFHLSMNADDEGFVNNPKRIRKVCGANEDDLQHLIRNGFLIRFNSGICVIIHWKINNTLRKDRFKATNYLEEKAMLVENTAGVYSLKKEVEKPVKQSEETPVEEPMEEASYVSEAEPESQKDDVDDSEINAEPEKKSEETAYDFETVVNKSYAEMIFDIYFSHGLPCGKNIIEFTMRDFRLASVAIKRLQLNSEDVIQAVKNYLKVIELKRKGLTWWNSEQSFYSFCEKNTILQFIPANFNFEKYTKNENGMNSMPADRIEL
jgi:phage replication initiation protein